jgi:hypothetical protein
MRAPRGRTDTKSSEFGSSVLMRLARHPETQSEDVRNITAGVRRGRGGALTVTYTIEGSIARLRVPAPSAARIAERLWQHTCCELFVAQPDSAAYHEFNFSPSGEWSVYAFERYRHAVPLGQQTLDPQISVRRTDSELKLEAVAQLSPPWSGKLLLGISAVIEERGGALSYWALRHPPGKPDFHHAGGFALELDEVRS